MLWWENNWNFKFYGLDKDRTKGTKKNAGLKAHLTPPALNQGLLKSPWLGTDAPWNCQSVAHKHRYRIEPYQLKVGYVRG